MKPRRPPAEEVSLILDAVAHEFHATLRDVFSFEEIRSMGAVAAANAVRRWDGRGHFGPFAVQRVRWGIIDELRRERRQQRSPRARSEIAAVLATQSAADVVEREAERSKIGDEPTLDGLLRESATEYYCEVSAGPAPDEDGLSAEERVEHNAERMRVRRAIEQMASPMRQVTELRLYERQTFDEIAAVLGIGRSTASDIYARAIRWLHGVFGGTGSAIDGAPELETRA